MNIRKYTLAAAIILGLAILETSCGGNEPKKDTSDEGINRSSENTNPDTKPAITDIDPMTTKGIGPIETLTLSPEVDEKMAGDGKTVFEANCTACHKPTEQKLVGPGLAEVTKRRTPEWIMNMILNPVEMTQKDPVAQKLLAEIQSQMTNQNLTKDQARQVLEFFRKNDGKK